MTAGELAVVWSRWRGVAFGIAALLGVALGWDALRELGRELDYAAIVTAVRATPWTDLAAAALTTLVSYLALSGYDWSALRTAGAALPWRTVAQTSFVAYALGNSMGVGVLTGGAVRLRMYGAVGVDASTVSRVIALAALAFGWGITTIGAAAALSALAPTATALHLPGGALRAIATTVLAASIALCLWLGTGRRVSVLGHAIDLPSAGVALRQLAISGIDILASAATLWWLLPEPVPFPAFVACYAVATALGVLSHVPGGLGVFEALMFVALHGQIANEDLVGALVLYRLVYYVAPLVLALGLLVAAEARRGLAAPMLRAATAVAPLLLAAYTLLAAVMLLVSGVLPASDDAAAFLADAVPLPLVEAAHFLGSIAGLALLVVARGMLLRLDAAWWAGLVLAIVSLVLAFPKGIAWSEAGFLSVLVVALLLSHQCFTRRASLFALTFTPGWLGAIGAVLAATTGLLWIVYRDVEYSRELWWQFEFDAHAPRALRAMLAVDLLALALALRQLLRPQAPPLQLPDAEALERAARVIQTQNTADACLALMGDKHLLFSADERAFVMFGVHRRSWIALFDPVGAGERWPDLIWRFIESAHEAGARPSFYQVRAAHLALYLDAGLRLFKLGEYAYVPLAEFSLRGRARQDLRGAVHRAEREGLRCEIVPSATVPTLLPALREEISDAWLEAHAAAEKRFSLGAFDPDYLARQPLALVARGERPLAFATLMVSGGQYEASVDLMRHHPDAPHGTMDFLFAQLLLHFQAAGYARFGLGMAPLSGMAAHPLAPHWHRIGRLLYAHGEHFYNFQGLRAFKEKFAPVWEPRYLACPGGVAPLWVLADVAALIGGGLRRVVAK